MLFILDHGGAEVVGGPVAVEAAVGTPPRHPGGDLVTPPVGCRDRVGRLVERSEFRGTALLHGFAGDRVLVLDGLVESQVQELVELIVIH